MSFISLYGYIRSQKISGTAQALLGGDEIYHYSTKVSYRTFKYQILKIKYLLCFSFMNVCIFHIAHDERASDWGIICLASGLWILLSEWVYFS